MSIRFYYNRSLFKVRAAGVQLCTGGLITSHQPPYLIVNRERELGLDRRETG